ASKTNSDDNTAIFETCGDQTVTASIRIPDQFKNQLLIQWFKDGIEKEDWVGKMAVTMKDAGTYQAKITALCEGIALSTIPIVIKNNTDPEITFNYPPEINICESSSFTFNTDSHPGYTYKWFKDDLEITGQSNNYYVARSAGTYRVEVSNCAGYYKSSASVKVNLEVLPLPVITADKQDYCKGEAAVLTVNNPEAFHIRWYLNEIEQPDFADHTTLTAITQGGYRAVFENSNYCSKTSAVFNFTPHDIPEALITRSINRSLCYGETVSLSTATLNGAVYRWNTGETTPAITVRTSGTYFVEVTSEFGCTKKSNEIDVVVRDQLLLSKPADVKICTIAGEQVRLTAEPGYAVYTWNGHRGNDFLDVNTPGQYTLEVEDANGCKANTVFIVLPWCKDVVMPNTFSPNGDGTNDFWTVGGLENDPGATIRIYTRNGSLVFEGRGSKPVWDGRYKGSDLPVGVYYYLISTRNSLKPLTGWVTIIR
ncbi:MAG TPA: gliding motility-associated C-terminal domain-containing protein, partial [Pedobacter sp.]